MNALVGERLSIITSKAQTTRHRILGIVTGENHQIVYSDTPGIIKPNYKLQEKMMKFVDTTFSDADVFLVITDIFEDIALENNYLERLQKTDTPILLLINKMDIATLEKVAEKEQEWRKKLPKAHLLPVSALKHINLDMVTEKIIELLPEGQPYYENDTLTDKQERFFVTEIIREKILQNYKQEIPYAVEVVVNSFKESEDIIRIEAIILVERDSQKGIIIGNKGAALKKTGTEARIAMEAFFKKKIFLQLFVKVDPDWRNNERQLKRYGYE